MDIPLAEPLAATIAATPMIGVKTFLAAEYGKRFTPAAFGNWFRDRCDEAGLPQCSAHGLRKAFLRRMAEAGCSEDYIRLDQRPQRYARNQDLRASRQQGEDGDRGNGLAVFSPKKEAG